MRRHDRCAARLVFCIFSVTKRDGLPRDLKMSLSEVIDRSIFLGIGLIFTNGLQTKDAFIVQAVVQKEKKRKSKYPVLCH